MNSFHILNGDALLHQFPEALIGEKIIFREILIEGPIQKDKFFEARAKFIQNTYGVSQEDYKSKSKVELQKIDSIPDNSEINLWFEDDLFCQCNLWYIAHKLLSKADKQSIFLVRPNSESWKGFGNMSMPDLLQAFHNRIQLDSENLEAFDVLWENYISKETKIEKKILESLSTLIPRIKDVLQAHIDRLPPNNRPYNSLKNIIESSDKTDFPTIFKAFSEKEGIYGYGDSSIKRMYHQIMKKD